MLSEQYKIQLVELRPPINKNIGKLFGKLSRFIHIWHEERNPYPERSRISSSLAALLNNIDLDGNQNKDLVKCTFASKQAMSKLLIETEQDGLIEIQKNKEDCRANKIFLTDSGAEMLFAIWDSNEKLIEEFESHLGKEKTTQLLDLLSELSESLILKNKI